MGLSLGMPGLILVSGGILFYLVEQKTLSPALGYGLFLFIILQNLGLMIYYAKRKKQN